MNLFDLKGRVAIVTGGNGGIGLGMAEGLAQAGATVMLAGRNAKKAESALAALRKTGSKAEFCEGDVTKEADCQALVTKTVDTFGRVDILINNAGTNVRKQPEQLTLAEWMHVMDTNLTSTFMCAQAVYPAMLKAKAGKIVNIGSMLSIFGTVFRPGLRRQQRRRGAIDEVARIRLGEGQHPGERGVAGLDRNRSDRRRQARGRRAQRARRGAHAGEALGQARRARRRCGVPVQRRLGLRHRHGDPGRRRLLGAGLGVSLHFGFFASRALMMMALSSPP